MARRCPSATYRQRAFSSPEERAKTEAVFAEYNVTNAATSFADVEFAALAAERAKAHPFRYYVELPVARVANMWLRPRTEMMDVPLDWWRFRDNVRGCIVAAVAGIINLGYLVLTSIGFWRWRRQDWSDQRPLGYAMIGFVLLRSGLLLTVDNSEPRYTIDCYPIIILLASFALAKVVRQSSTVREIRSQLI